MSDAVVRDRRRDHRHLLRRHLQLGLAEREPTRVDLGESLGSKSLPFL
jgi:hypothetical protein